MGRGRRRSEQPHDSVRHVLQAASRRSACSLDSSSLYPLPRVSVEVRDAIVERIDRTDGETFTHEAIDNLETRNPELLQMAHGYASRRPDYGRTMRFRPPP
jgi:hypothetical protein